MIHYISPKYDVQDYDFSLYTSYLSKYCRCTGKTPFFISDWNSDKSVLTPTVLARIAFDSSIDNIDNYYSSGDNYCQDLLVDMLRKDFNLNYQRNQITIGNNATSIISFCIQNLLSMGISNYLAIAPVYFSAVDAIQLGHGSISIIQPKLPDLSLDLNKFEETIRKLSIQAVIITDPYFGFGKEICMNQFEQILQICNDCYCTVICDFARYGLHWSNEKNHLIFNEKINLFQNFDRYALIYSPCKQLFANGIKSAIMLTSDNVTESITDYSDSVLGSVSTAQLAFLSSILDSQNQSEITSIIKRNIAHIQANCDKIRSCILGSGVVSFLPDMGNYMVLGLPKTVGDYETFQYILNCCNISTLPLSLYNFFDRTHYFFRVNLSLDPVHLLSSILALEEITGYTQ